MKTKIRVVSAFAITCLFSGCVDPGFFYVGDSEYYAPEDEYYAPRVVIVEDGIRHDRYFYQRHPECYNRDRMRYPSRFGPPRPEYHREGGYYSGHSRHGSIGYQHSVTYRGHVTPPRPDSDREHHRSDSDKKHKNGVDDKRRDDHSR